MNDSERWRADEVRAWLKEARSAKMRMDRAAENYLAMREAVDGLKAVRYDTVGGSSMEHGDDAVFSRLELLHEAAQRSADRQLEWERVLLDVDRALDSMEDTVAAALIEDHYVYGVAWWQTAEKLGYSESRARHLAYEALPSLWPAMPERYRSLERAEDSQL